MDLMLGYVQVNACILNIILIERTPTDAGENDNVASDGGSGTSCGNASASHCGDGNDDDDDADTDDNDTTARMKRKRKH